MSVFSILFILLSGPSAFVPHFQFKYHHDPKGIIANITNRSHNVLRLNTPPYASKHHRRTIGTGARTIGTGARTIGTGARTIGTGARTIGTSGYGPIVKRNGTIQRLIATQGPITPRRLIDASFIDASFIDASFIDASFIDPGILRGTMYACIAMYYIATMNPPPPPPPNLNLIFI